MSSVGENPIEAYEVAFSGDGYQPSIYSSNSDLDIESACDGTIYYHARLENGVFKTIKKVTYVRISEAASQNINKEIDLGNVGYDRLTGNISIKYDTFDPKAIFMVEYVSQGFTRDTSGNEVAESVDPRGVYLARLSFTTKKIISYSSC